MKIKQRIRPATVMLFAMLAAFALSVSFATVDNVTEASDALPDSKAATSVAIFAGGCFWCIESDFEAVPGVIDVVSGYSGGKTSSPTYKNHHAGMHREVVQITYDSSMVSYGQLLHAFWRSVDPTDAGGQFCDRGHSYTTAIYALDQKQFNEAIESKTMLTASGVLSNPVVTPIESADKFWPAENYHQDYYKKNPIRYKYYRKSCGRDKRVKNLWGAQAHSGIERH